MRTWWHSLVSDQGIWVLSWEVSGKHKPWEENMFILAKHDWKPRPAQDLGSSSGWSSWPEQPLPGQGSWDRNTCWTVPGDTQRGWSLVGSPGFGISNTSPFFPSQKQIQISWDSAFSDLSSSQGESTASYFLSNWRFPFRLMRYWFCDNFLSFSISLT